MWYPLSRPHRGFSGRGVWSILSRFGKRCTHSTPAMRKCLCDFIAPPAVASGGLVFGEFHLDPPVAAIGVLAVAGLERLLVGKAGGGKPVGRDAFVDRI